MTLPVTALTAAFLAFLILLTAIMTVKARFKSQAAFGMDDNDQPLINASRSHGNLTEHAPMFVIIVALLELSNAHHFALMALCVLFMAARVSHIIGLHIVHQQGKPPAPRAMGVVGTWVSYAWAIGWVGYMIVVGNL